MAVQVFKVLFNMTSKTCDVDFSGVEGVPLEIIANCLRMIADDCDSIAEEAEFATIHQN